MKKSAIGIIGTGSVGSTIAYSLILKNVCSQILLFDNNEKFGKAQAEDLSDALEFSSIESVKFSTFEDIKKADIIIVCAGSPQHPDQPRADLMVENAQVIKKIMTQISPLSKDTILIMVTNPVDILTQYAQNLSGLPHNQVIGSGTLLDTLRWRGYISEIINVAPQSIQAFILGNHGDLQVPIISSASLDGTTLSEVDGLSEDTLSDLAKKAKNKVYELIDGKGFTQYGIGSCIATLCENIIYDKKEVFPIVSYNPMHKLYMSNLSTLGKNGIDQLIETPISPEEKESLEKSIKSLKNAYSNMLVHL